MQKKICPKCRTEYPIDIFFCKKCIISLSVNDIVEVITNTSKNTESKKEPDSIGSPNSPETSSEKGSPIDPKGTMRVQSESFLRIEHIPTGKVIKANSSQILGRETLLELEKFETISRKHCILIETENLLCIRDNKSVNGTFLNDCKCQPDENFPIKKGDILRLADQPFKTLDVYINR